MSISSTDSRLMCGRICQAANQLIHHKLRPMVRNQMSISSTDSTLMCSTICQAANQLIHHTLRSKLSRASPSPPQPSLKSFAPRQCFRTPLSIDFLPLQAQARNGHQQITVSPWRNNMFCRPWDVQEGPLKNNTKSLGGVNPPSRTSSAGLSLGGLTPPSSGAGGG